MTFIKRLLWWANLVGAAAYLIICGVLLTMGRPPYPGQAMLLGQVAFGILATLAPGFLERTFHFRFPEILVTIFYFFILTAVLLGTGMQFYNIPYWDKFLHLFSASMLAGLGLAIFGALLGRDQLRRTRPLLLALFAVAFGTMVGVLWEFYEFTGDGLLGLNMQRTMSGTHPLLGRLALMDTMGDLFADFGGSLLLGLLCYFGVKKDPAWLDTFMFEKSA
ncbi:hypothetical protein [Lacticaseibacillus yichunensis]|uniref:Integral membrane protein n=1 Tax=Lacticaseibacillus yichunensis TaxID=2486015 RepID=A0ABW4CSX2_9LACO|nr:hypothetical protein [Lacticaseibacillus yichunensis]